MGETPQLFPVLMGLCRYYSNRGAFQTAQELDPSCSAWRSQHDPTRLLQEARKLSERPTIEELRQRLRQRRPVQKMIDAATLIREGRGPLPDESG